MNVKERILSIRLIEKSKKQMDFSKKILTFDNSPVANRKIKKRT